MYFFVFALVILPFFAEAIRLPRSHRHFNGHKRGRSIPITKHGSPPDPSRPEDIAALHAHTDRVITKLHRGVSRYRRNIGRKHPLSQSITLPRSEKRDTESEPLVSSNLEQWFFLLNIGTPFQKFMVILDTGSADAFVPLNECSTYCAGHSSYIPAASLTSCDTKTTANIAFNETGIVTGEVFTDVVSIAGLAALDQTFLAATAYTEVFDKSVFAGDGLLGTAFQSLSELNVRPVLETLVMEHALDNGTFSLKLDTSANSECFIGGANQALYTGDIAWTEVTVVGFWQVMVQSISVNGVEVIRNNQAILDSGTLGVIGDLIGIQNIFAQIVGAQLAPAFNNHNLQAYTIPCDSNTPIVITLGGKDIVVAPNTFNLGYVEPTRTTCLAAVFGSSDLKDDLWILGTAFLRNIYTVFDITNARVGFADLARP